MVRERDSLVMQELGTAHGGVGWSGGEMERGVEGAKEENHRGLITHVLTEFAFIRCFHFLQLEIQRAVIGCRV